MRAIEVTRTELDGMPAYVTEAGPAVPIVGLSFRVGRVDETAATSGLAHLVEHLALPARTDEAVDFNGSVESMITTFYASGSPDELRAFVSSTVASIRDLPLERLDTERRILRAEEASRGSGGARQALALRYGPVGVGLIGYDEYGLRRLGPDEVEQWAATRFTRESAVLWVAGTPFEGFTVDLPAGGSRTTPPEPHPIEDLRTPSVYSYGSGTGMCLSFVAPRTTATRIALDALGDALRDRLRYELGLSYSVDLDLHPMSPTLTHAVVTADVADDDVDVWLTETVGVLDVLGSDGPPDARLTRLKESTRRWELDPSAWSGWVAWCADWELVGNAPQSRAEHLAEREAISGEDVARTVRDMKTSLLVLGPDTTPVLDGFEEYPLTSRHRVEGRRHRPSGRRDRLRRQYRHVELTSGPEGVTLVTASGKAITARYASTVLCLREVGERTLLTDDGFFLTVTARDWTNGESVVEGIDESIPADLVVRMDGELGERIEQVQALSRSTFKRTWLVSEELETLPGLLEQGEQLLSLAGATRGWRYGLLVLTDRYLRFVYGDGTKRSFTAELDHVSVRDSGGSKLELRVDGERVDLTEIEPKGKAAEFAQLLGGAS